MNRQRIVREKAKLATLKPLQTPVAKFCDQIVDTYTKVMKIEKKRTIISTEQSLRKKE